MTTTPTLADLRAEATARHEIEGKLKAEAEEAQIEREIAFKRYNEAAARAAGIQPGETIVTCPKGWFAGRVRAVVTAGSCRLLDRVVARQVTKANRLWKSHHAFTVDTARCEATGEVFDNEAP